MAGAAYLVDTTVFVLRGRHDDVKQRFDSLLIEGRLVFCQMVLLECLNNAPDPKSYERLWATLHGQRWVDVTAEAMDRALDVHRTLAKKSQHRGFKLPDLIIAATAELGGPDGPALRRGLRPDRQDHRAAGEWVAPKGSL